MKRRLHRTSGRGLLGSPSVLVPVLCAVALGAFSSGVQGSATIETPQDQGIVAQLRAKIAKLEAEMGKARSEQAHVLSPNVFREARKTLDEAKEDLDKAKNVTDIQKKLVKAEERLALAVRNAKEARKQLPDLIVAANEALAADAPQYAPELYEAGEKAFNEAMKEIEDADINGALKKGKEAEEKLRDAELQAIKVSIIGKVHESLRLAEEAKADKYAPLTLTLSKSLLQEAENILDTDRKAQATAREKAEMADYEANHAIYLAKLVEEYKKDEENWEKLILGYENDIRTVAKELNFKPRFDTGLAKPLRSVHLAVVSIKNDNQRLTQELDEQNAEVASYRASIASMRSELDKSKAEEAGLKEKLEAEKRQEAKIKRVEVLFTPSEAEVIREGTNLKIRLVGLTFASGKSEIDVEYFDLLTKAQQAIREFPDCQIVIEGHTDAIGHESTNLRLSTERANAVLRYLVANMGLPESRIRAVGYGKGRPIASNETEVGRRKNRRIDVVLEIGEATY